ncbi:hypothetical protein F5Y06DRAFT_136540 [Hypoxylon sp. FL0890]|nr:hypothetical protein F5Y06DRAFT_136540 [Hypoxylon sp. FL0890]
MPSVNSHRIYARLPFSSIFSLLLFLSFLSMCGKERNRMHHTQDLLHIPAAKPNSWLARLVSCDGWAQKKPKRGRGERGTRGARGARGPRKMVGSKPEGRTLTQ